MSLKSKRYIMLCADTHEFKASSMVYVGTAEEIIAMREEEPWDGYSVNIYELGREVKLQKKIEVVAVEEPTRYIPTQEGGAGSTTTWTWKTPRDGWYDQIILQGVGGSGRTPPDTPDDKMLRNDLNRKTWG